MNQTVKKIGNIVLTFALPVGLYLLVLAATLISGKSANFASLNLISALLRDCALGYIVALAMSFNMRNGRIDMSVGGVVVLTSILAGNLAVSFGIGAVGMLFLCILIAGILGLLSGFVYIKLRLPAVILSLGLLMLLEAITQIVYGGRGAAIYDENMRFLHNEPWIYLIMLSLGLLFHFLTEKTRYAYDSKALAGNQITACNLGVNNPRNAVLSYLFSGLFLGVGAVIYISDTGMISSANNMSSANVMFDAILPSLIGTFLSRKSNMAIGIFVGVLSMKVIKFGLVALSINSNFQNVITSVVLIALIVIVERLDQKGEKNRIKERRKILTGKEGL